MEDLLRMRDTTAAEESTAELDSSQEIERNDDFNKLAEASHKSNSENQTLPGKHFAATENCLPISLQSPTTSSQLPNPTEIKKQKTFHEESNNVNSLQSQVLGDLGQVYVLEVPRDDGAITINSENVTQPPASFSMESKMDTILNILGQMFFKIENIEADIAEIKGSSRIGGSSMTSIGITNIMSLDEFPIQDENKLYEFNAKLAEFSYNESLVSYF